MGFRLGKERLVDRFAFFEVCRGEKVGLIQCQQDKRQAGEGLKALRNQAVFVGGIFAGIHQPDDAVHILKDGNGFLVHKFAQFMVRVMDTGCIYKNNLRPGAGQDAQLAAAGSLRAGGYGGHFLLEQRIEQGGFAHIGASDKSDITRIELIHSSCHP